jgi:diguanylate cyclase (GGDEF)-like protein
MWKTPRSALLLILSAELACVTWLITANVYGPPGMSDLGRVLLVFLVAAVYSEGGDRIERLRRYVGYVENTTFINASSLWCFAAALVLPPQLAGVVAVGIYAHALFRAKRHHAARQFRMIYTGTTEVLATMTAALVFQAVAGDGGLASLWSAVGVVAALLAYAVVNQGLVLAAVLLVSRARSLRSILPGVEDEAMELATLCLGVLFAIAVVHAPLLAPFTLPLILVLRRSALVRELQVQATRDAKTGLLNAGAWRREADRELVRAERIGGRMSVLMIDLDHFKKLNDLYGHPAGDATLVAVAECLTDALRGYDAIGRFGGEEFIALLSDADETVSLTVADRLCARIRGLQLSHGGGVTASIGVGVGTPGQHDLDALIDVADKALYVAKGCGRDQVRLMRAPSVRRVDGQSRAR